MEDLRQQIIDILFENGFVNMKANAYEQAEKIMGLMKKTEPVAKSPAAMAGYAQATDLLMKMEKACKVKCWCSLKLIDGNIAMRWLGVIKPGKHGENKEFGLEIIVPRFELEPIDILIDKASRALDAKIKECGA